jgi:hypothetical protein
VMVDQVCRGVVPVVAAVLAQEGPLLVREVEPVAERQAEVGENTARGRRSGC